MLSFLSFPPFIRHTTQTKGPPFQLFVQIDIPSLRLIPVNDKRKKKCQIFFSFTASLDHHHLAVRTGLQVQVRLSVSMIARLTITSKTTPKGSIQTNKRSVGSQAVSHSRSPIPGLTKMGKEPVHLNAICSLTASHAIIQVVPIQAPSPLHFSILPLWPILTTRRNSH